MVTILFFGQLKERLETSRLPLELVNGSEGLDSVAKLRDFLLAKGDVWKENLAYGSALVAVNQQMATEDTPIKDSDEIAFFPPVTGG
ncbi:MoaD/ThiS family protein [Paraglaciecola marina]|uniref:MoaD/ThiS family protein n=1 Tax=Paraglaciecola marina TaxID=2500157 RepID=UPI00105D8D4F|nr:MoaD/ThiS family protein [Paraglaciecola marina]